MTQTSPDEHRGPVPVNRFVWERLLMMSDLPQEDRFKLLALGMFMDGETGDGARPGAASLAMFGHHEETWKQLLRRTVAAGWLILRERGGSRKGPNGTRIRKASRYAASVPADVYDRRGEILGRPPFKASKEASGSTKEARERPAKGGPALPSKNDASTKEVQRASFDAPGPVDNPPAPAYEGSPSSFEGSPETLRSRPAPESTKEASGVYEGSAEGLRRKRNCASPSISPSSTTSTSISQSARVAEALRLLCTTYGLTDEEAAVAWKTVEVRSPTEIRNPVRYLDGMVADGSLADIVDAIQTAGRGALADEPEPEPPPLHALPGGASSSDSTATQPSLFIRAVPDEQPEDEPERTPLPFYEPDGEDQRTAAPLLEELRRKWQADREAAAPDQTG